MLDGRVQTKVLEDGAVKKRMVRRKRISGRKVGNRSVKTLLTDLTWLPGFLFELFASADCWALGEGGKG